MQYKEVVDNIKSRHIRKVLWRCDIMAMLSVICKDCKEEFSFRGWIDREDLKGTEYESQIDSITDEELYSLEKTDKIKDEWEKFEENPVALIAVHETL